MARYLIFLNLGLAVLGAMMLVGTGISALLLGWHLGEAPRFRGDYVNLVRLTVVFTALTVVAVAAGWALLRRPRWPLAAHLGLQAAFFLGTVGTWLYSVAMLGQ